MDIMGAKMHQNKSSHQYKLSIGYYLATQAIKEKYEDTAEKVRQRQNLKEFFLSTKKFNRKMYFRLQKLEINKIMAETVLSSLNKEKLTFIEYKYKNNFSMAKISFKMNISIAQLSIWNKEILEEVRDFIFYQLRARDVFSYKKIINMITIMNITIIMLKENDIVDENWLNGFSYLRDNYFRLLSTINDYLANRRDSIHNMVICCKIDNPDLDICQLAAKCYVSPSIVSRHLKKFVKEVNEYVIS
ncbi:hypothetical protein [Pectinatus frisingensis]|uniref:hypothetical protein n=1 Tax=Pectinatus frisingensis TaxID=865 RepID=UPI003D8046B9